MALKPTIYKFNIALSDMDRDHYEALNLTTALHPSETLERMMVRVLAFCLNAQENLAFTKGLSVPEEPDIRAKGLDDQVLLWVDVGEPAVDRIKKATWVSKEVKVYSFNSKSDVWWQQACTKFQALGASIYRFKWEDATALASLVQRTMELSVTITDGAAYIAGEGGDLEVTWETLYAP